MEKLVIIGAGQSAIQCITSLKKEGYSGSIALVGEEEHLPYQRPPLSKGFLEDSINKERLYFKKLDFFTENKIQLHLGLSAEKVNLENNKVSKKDQAARQMGISAVPMFIVAEHYAVSGAQTSDLWKRVIKEIQTKMTIS